MTSNAIVVVPAPAEPEGPTAPTISNSTNLLTALNATSRALAFGSSVTSGNVLFIGAAIFVTGVHGPLTAAMCTQTAGGASLGTVTLDKAVDLVSGGSDSLLVGIWSVPVVTGGPCTITVNVSSLSPGNTFISLYMAEGSSVDTSGTRVNDSNSATDTTELNAAISSGNVATGGAGVIFGLCAPGSPFGTITLTEDGAFTKLGEVEDDSQQNSSFIYRTVSVNTTDSADWTAGVNCADGSVAVAYKSSSP